MKRDWLRAGLVLAPFRILNSPSVAGGLDVTLRSINPAKPKDAQWKPRGDILASAWDYGHVVQEIPLLGTLYSAPSANTALNIQGPLGWINPINMSGYCVVTPRIYLQ